MTVASILKAKPADIFTLRPQQSVGEAAAVLAERRIGAVVVIDATGRLAGILSERDIVRALATAGVEALQAPISDYATRNVETATPAEPIVSIMERMTRGRFRHMPVLDGGRIVGLVSIGDVVKHRLATMEAEANAMRSYIASA